MNPRPNYEAGYYYNQQFSKFPYVVLFTEIPDAFPSSPPLSSPFIQLIQSL